MSRAVEITSTSLSIKACGRFVCGQTAGSHRKSRLDDCLLLSDIGAGLAWVRSRGTALRFLTYEIFFRMAPPAVCNLGRVRLRAAWGDAGPGSESSGAAGPSDHPVNRGRVHRTLDGEQGADSRANANQSGPALFRSSS